MPLYALLCCSTAISRTESTENVFISTNGRSKRFGSEAPITLRRVTDCTWTPSYVFFSMPICSYSGGLSLNDTRSSPEISILLLCFMDHRRSLPFALHLCGSVSSFEVQTTCYQDTREQPPSCSRDQKFPSRLVAVLFIYSGKGKRRGFRECNGTCIFGSFLGPRICLLLWANDTSTTFSSNLQKGSSKVSQTYSAAIAYGCPIHYPLSGLAASTPNSTSCFTASSSIRAHARIQCHCGSTVMISCIIHYLHTCLVKYATVRYRL